MTQLALIMLGVPDALSGFIHNVHNDDDDCLQPAVITMNFSSRYDRRSCTYS